MPLFDVRCPSCGEIATDRLVWHGQLPACASCGGPTEKLPSLPHMVPDTVPGGFTVEHMADRPLTFDSTSAWKREMAKRGLVNKVRHTPPPGTDKSKHTTRWI